MIEPYYQREGVRIYHGDCRDVMPFLEGVDLVVADPNYKETSLAWDKEVDGWISVAESTLSPSGSMWCFGSLSYFMRNASLFSRWTKSQEVVWEKHNGSGMANDRFRRVHELLVHFYPKSHRWRDVFKCPQFTMDATPRAVRRKALAPHIQGARGPSYYVSIDGGPRLMRSVQKVRTCHGSALHPTQKPEGIVAPAMRYACPGGGTVLEPFMGSGTSLVVARSLGMHAIGIDKDEHWCEVAAKRLEDMIDPQ